MSAPTALASSRLAALYGNHAGWLRDWLRRRLGCPHEAADLAHDTFVRLLRTPGHDAIIGGLREPRSYLATLAQRAAIDHLRRKRLEQAWLETLAQLPEAVMPSAEECAAILQTLHRLDAMLAGLGDKVRQAFLLSQFEGMPYAQIAQRLGVTVSSVKKYMARATEHALLVMLADDAAGTGLS
ncbi:sigma-70 family RNA polymerase sigma factor [Verticiella sediminum]|uniref:Sigma-70 family RNA polymerase sigma factor n=1 Tax=Verticiella sediminum TaxID=1247510 RepID=A0A556B0V5_9BURK|nr:sigma-70 family RNA polymerase sigma factor [Verticiella sediminum]TSH98827.1 sigma-70 family RNA polymerase sigma factor [Verticiella sediminum]